MLIDNDSQMDRGVTTLDKLPLRAGGEIIAVDWSQLSDKDARRLRELGVDEGVPVEKLHKGPFGVDPIACRIGRMTVALRSAQAAAISVGPRQDR